MASNFAVKLHRLSGQSVRPWSSGGFSCQTNFHVSNEKNLGWLGYIGDDKLPNYIGIIMNHCKDPGIPINHPV